MTAKRFTYPLKDDVYYSLGLFRDNGKEMSKDDVLDILNNLYEENMQLRNRIKDWHQRTFKAHEYFNILEKVIDEVCNDDISNQIWKEYEKRERLIE